MHNDDVTLHYSQASSANARGRTSFVSRSGDQRFIRAEHSVTQTRRRVQQPPLIHPSAYPFPSLTYALLTHRTFSITRKCLSPENKLRLPCPYSPCPPPSLPPKDVLTARTISLPPHELYVPRHPTEDSLRQHASLRPRRPSHAGADSPGDGEETVSQRRQTTGS